MNNGFINILVVDDEADSRTTMEMLLSTQNYNVTTCDSAKAARELVQKNRYNIVLTDIMMPGEDGLSLLKWIKNQWQSRTEVIVITGYSSIENAVEAMKQGAYGYFAKGSNPELLLMEIKKALVSQDAFNYAIIQSEQQSKYLLSSKNEKMKKLWDMVETAAMTNANVLILGESGVGKEIIARELHQRSPRKKKPFIALNCQAFPHELIESELFGHEKGSFTGAAAQRIGKIEQVNGGTLFMDEIGDMSSEIQVKLLRVLEEKNIERIGGNALIPVDFRLIAATNKNLEKAIEAGEFRLDLFFRINTVTFTVPPLRERKEDLPELIDFFVKKYSKSMSKSVKEINGDTMDFLLKYDYPGNIRELKNIIERMFIFSNNGTLELNENITPDMMQTVYAGKEPKSISDYENVKTYKEAKKSFEYQYVTDVLAICEGNITKAAVLMNISRRQLFNKITELGIEVETIKQDI